MAHKQKPIPQFPRFRNIRLYDKSIIDEYIKFNTELSELTFSSLYSWRSNNLTSKLSVLGDDLMVKTCDVGRGKYNLWILSKKYTNLNKQLAILLRSTDYPDVCVPNIDISKISNKYEIIDDVINFEYIYDTRALSEVKGKQYSVTRANINKFKRTYSEYTVGYLDNIIIGGDNHSLIVGLFTYWNSYKNRIQQSASYFEFDALERYLRHSRLFGVVIITINIGNELIGFGTVETDDNDVSIRVARVLFAKSNHKYKGSSEVLISSIANYLSMRNIKLMNFEQDLGIESLGNYKKKLRPIKLLPLYRVTLRK